jgi:hypothetical protein
MNMTPGPAAALSVSEVYEVLRDAATRRQPVAATYDGQLRLMLGAESQADGMSCAMSLEERATVPGR